MELNLLEFSLLLAGLARARLWDTTGPVGRSLQTLLLERRAGG